MRDLTTLWFDKDGVLAQYDYRIYEPVYGAPAPWKIRNTHIYRGIEPYEDMCAAVHKLYGEVSNVHPDKRFCNIRVLTAVCDGVTLSEHVIDGMYWCKKHLDLSESDFFACAVSKENIPIDLHAEINSLQILFDDYMPNLRKWRDVGGTAVKVLNGINTCTQEFPCLPGLESKEYIYALLKQIVTDVENQQQLKTGILNVR